MAMAKNLRLGVVAKGAETLEQVSLLKRLQYK
jgi:sensor c-di-GMP phosphodiesterase-like protein